MSACYFPAIFGQPLAETMAFENRTSKRKVPQIVELCIEFLLEHGLRVEGIFRFVFFHNLGRIAHILALDWNDNV